MSTDLTGKRFQDPNTNRPADLDDIPADSPIVETPVQARQGFLGWPVLAVLVASITLAVIAGIATGTMSF